MSRRDRFQTIEEKPVPEKKVEEELFDGLPINSGISIKEHESIRKEALEQAKNIRHTWRQNGPWIRCKSCATPHGFWIGTEKRMTGEKPDGTPIFTDCKV